MEILQATKVGGLVSVPRLCSLPPDGLRNQVPVEAQVKISGKTGLLDYLQLLSGPDQVHRPYSTSYPTFGITLCYHVVTRPTEVGDLLPLVSETYGFSKPLLDYFPMRQPSLSQIVRW